MNYYIYYDDSIKQSIQENGNGLYPEVFKHIQKTLFNLNAIKKYKYSYKTTKQARQYNIIIQDTIRRDCE